MNGMALGPIFADVAWCTLRPHAATPIAGTTTKRSRRSYLTFQDSGGIHMYRTRRVSLEQ